LLIVRYHVPFSIKGVSHLPEVHTIDLDAIFKSHTNTSEPLVLCMVVASDGVWDNWLYEDVTKFVMDASCLKAVQGSVDGAQRVGKSFMARNTLFSKRNFGNQADNATGIVLYLRDSE
jgi:serine/threonine protein phosphatase PrpC